MEWNATWEDPLTSYVKQFDGLIGDQRTRKTFGEIVKGIIRHQYHCCARPPIRRVDVPHASLNAGRRP